MTRFTAGPAGEGERHDSENEGERCHQNRTEPNPRRFHGGINYRHPARPQLLGKFHDENAVLRREPNQHDQANLTVHVINQSPPRLRRERAHDGQRNRQQNDERQRDALVLAGQRQIHEQEAEAKDGGRLPPD